MKYKLVAIRDNKANMFWQPQVQTNYDTAKRDFAIMINSSEARSVTGFAPGDFDLYCVGVFDSESGVIEPAKVPEFLVNGRSVLEVKNEE